MCCYGRPQHVNSWPPHRKLRLVAMLILLDVALPKAGTSEAGKGRKGRGGDEEKREEEEHAEECLSQPSVYCF